MLRAGTQAKRVDDAVLNLRDLAEYSHWQNLLALQRLAGAVARRDAAEVAVDVVVTAGEVSAEAERSVRGSKMPGHQESVSVQ